MNNADTKTQSFDIVFAGAGLAGLAVAVEMLRHPFFRQKSLLLIDRDRKQQNDRTWCFWATDDEPIPPVVHRSWNSCRFFAPGFEAVLDIAPYRYRMVRGLDFYHWAGRELEQWPNVRRLTANIQDIVPERGLVRTDAGDFEGDVVLNSAFTPIRLLPENTAGLWQSPLSVLREKAQTHRATFLLQHFKGWMVETPADAFDPDAMTFMDFRMEQQGETRFVYVLPLSTRRALVEFTVFSPALLPAAAYEEALRRYLQEQLCLRHYAVVEEEFGIIPMTDYIFPKRAEGRVIHIGTAGGFVKASSGYAFKRTLRRARAFAGAWAQTGVPDVRMLHTSSLFRLLDSVLLRVLHNQNDLGSVVFASLFRKLPPALVLRFLDEDSSWLDIVRVINAPPSWPFSRALAEVLLRR
ncbi:MAG: lycopene cyclase family protein [Saprospiraceae bacterium]|nr:lycopene cyclase family protein [Saprospiraceae bacterium]MDW8228796.1 lycopene cyclase family protein [Saprospiraceae bacterium]